MYLCGMIVHIRTCIHNTYVRIPKQAKVFVLHFSNPGGYVRLFKYSFHPFPLPPSTVGDLGERLELHIVDSYIYICSYIARVGL